jgi:hypothetical protein
MAVSQPGGKKHGVANDPAARRKILGGLSDAEKLEFDAIVETIDNGRQPTRSQRKTIRKWQQQGKIDVASKKFKSPSDKKTHQDP